MSVTAPKDTLAYQRKGRPLALKRNLSELPVVGTISPMKAFASNHGGSASPEREALWFYMTNHAVKEIEFRFDPDEPLPPPVLDLLEQYNKMNSIIAARAFYYLLLITCRESRHCTKKEKLKPEIEASWGAEAAKGIFYYPDHNDISSVCNVFSNYTPYANLRQITESVRYTFYASGAYHGGYGGPAWGKVSDCLVAYVTGDYTAEMMLDTVWTLCHNNGPIFNKGMLYGHYSKSLIEILDVQRSGQIPQLVMSSQHVDASAHVTPQMKEYAATVAKLFPDSDSFFADGEAKIDWHMVEALGGVGKYGKYKPGGAAANKDGYAGKKAPYMPNYGGGGHSDPDTPMHAKTLGDSKAVFALAAHSGLEYKKLTRKELTA